MVGRAKRRRVCSEHGFVKGQRCPECGDETYDLRDREDRSFLRTLVRQRRFRRWLSASGIGMLSAIAVTFGLDAALDMDLRLAARTDVLLLVMLALTLVVDAILVLRLPRRIRRFEHAVSPNNTVRTLFSVPALAAAACIVIFALTYERQTFGWFDRHVELMLGDGAVRFAMHPAAIRAGEGLPTLLSAGLLHARLDHLLSNLVGLLGFGLAVDLRLGRPRTAPLLVLGVVVGNLAHAWFTSTPQIPVVGISGGIFALAGCYLVLLPRRAVFIGAHGKLRIPAWIVIPAFALGLGVVLAAFIPNVAWIAHLAGFAVGAAYGLPMRRTEVPRAYREAEAVREMQVAL